MELEEEPFAGAQVGVTAVLDTPVGEDVCTVELVVAFDPRRLQVIEPAGGVDPRDFYHAGTRLAGETDSGFLRPFVDNAAGRIGFSWANLAGCLASGSPGNLPGGKGPVMRIPFRCVSGSGPTEVQVADSHRPPGSESVVFTGFNPGGSLSPCNLATGLQNRGVTVSPSCGPLVEYRITVEIEPPAGGLVEVAGRSLGDGATFTVPEGGSAVLEARPDTGGCFVFQAWGGDAGGTSPTLRLSDVRGDMTVVASFQRHAACLANFVEVVGAPRESVEVAVAGEEVTLEVVANQDRFLGWEGAASGSELRVTVPASALVSTGVQALFGPEGPPHGQVRVEVCPNGTVTRGEGGAEIPSGTVLEEPQGTAIPLLAAAAEGFFFTRWEVDGEPRGDDPALEVTVTAAPQTVRACFAALPVGSISYPHVSCGTVEVSWSPSPVDSYRLERSGDGGASWVDVFEGSGNAFADSGLEDGSYRYRVRVLSPGQNSRRVEGDHDVVVFTEIPAPTGLTVAAGGAFELAWEYGPQPFAVTFELEEATAPDFTDARVVFTGPEKEAVLARQAGCFYYRVRARAFEEDDCGPLLSPFSEPTPRQCAGGLVGSWPLDSNGDPDPVGEPALVNGIGAPDRFGEAGRSLLGEDPAVTASVAGLDTAATVAFWALLEESTDLAELTSPEAGRGLRVRWEANGSAGDGGGGAAGSGGGRLILETLAAGDATELIAVDLPPLEGWLHVAWVVEPGRVALWLNGIRAGERRGVNAALPDPAVLLLGSGGFDSLRVFEVPLSEARLRGELAEGRPALLVWDGENQVPDSSRGTEVPVPVLQVQLRALVAEARVTGLEVLIAGEQPEDIEILEAWSDRDGDSLVTEGTDERLSVFQGAASPEVELRLDPPLVAGTNGRPAHLLVRAQVRNLGGEARRYRFSVEPPGGVEAAGEVLEVGLPARGGEITFSEEPGAAPTARTIPVTDRVRRIAPGTRAPLQRLKIEAGSPQLLERIEFRRQLGSDFGFIRQAFLRLDRQKVAGPVEPGPDSIVFEGLAVEIAADRGVEIELRVELNEIAEGAGEGGGAGAVPPAGPFAGPPPGLWFLGAALAAFLAATRALRGRLRVRTAGVLAGSAAVLAVAAVLGLPSGCEETRTRTRIVEVPAPLEEESLGFIQTALESRGDITLTARGGEVVAVEGDFPITGPKHAVGR